MRFPMYLDRLIVRQVSYRLQVIDSMLIKIETSFQWNVHDR